MAPSRISVVIPTRNRADSVLRLLRCLDAQTVGSGEFEVIVVADGCSDQTVVRARNGSWRFALHVLEQTASGPAVARNCGAALAAGEILLFLDDDVEPEPGLIGEHAAFHARTPRAIGVGYLPPLVAHGGLFGQTLRGWWESMFDALRHPAHRYTWQNVLTGQLSIPRGVFAELGGFDPSLRCHEDYEFGYRAIEAGIAVRFLARAVAWHHERTDIPRALERKREEGLADVLLATRYPELTRALPLAWPVEGRMQRWLRETAWRAPRMGDLLVRGLVRWLTVYEYWQLRFRWRALLAALLAYWYWRGVAQAIGTRERLRMLLSDLPLPGAPEVTVDLAAGVAAAEAELDAQRPRSARLTYRDLVVGEIEPRPGAERLRGVHLRPTLARALAEPYLRALALSGQLPEPLATAYLRRVKAPGGSGPPAVFAA